MADPPTLLGTNYLTTPPLNVRDTVTLSQFDGTGPSYKTRFVAAVLAAASAGGGIIVVPGTDLIAGGFYGFDTTIPGLTAFLPRLNTVPVGSRIWVADIAYEASINPFTVSPISPDTLLWYASSPTALSFDINGANGFFVATASEWVFFQG